MTNPTTIKTEPVYLTIRQIDPKIQRTEAIRPWIFEILSEVGDALQISSKQSFASCLSHIVKKYPPAHHPEQAIAILENIKEALELSKPEHQEELEMWILQIAMTAKIFLDSQSIVEIKEISIPKELEKSLSTEPEGLSCFDYAFCQIKEKRALFTEYSNEQVPSLLKKWGYTQTKEPLPGDLALYLNQNQPTHLAVCRDKGLFESKWGNDTPVAYLHRIEQAPSSYGNEILYFRPLRSR